MTPRKESLKAAIERGIALRTAAIVLAPRLREPEAGLEDAHYTNRRMKRAQGQRGHGFGMGGMAVIRTRGR